MQCGVAYVRSDQPHQRQYFPHQGATTQCQRAPVPPPCRVVKYRNILMIHWHQKRATWQPMTLVQSCLQEWKTEFPSLPIVFGSAPVSNRTRATPIQLRSTARANGVQPLWSTECRSAPCLINNLASSSSVTKCSAVKPQELNRTLGVAPAVSNRRRRIRRLGQQQAQVSAEC